MTKSALSFLALTLVNLGGCFEPTQLGGQDTSSASADATLAPADSATPDGTTPDATLCHFNYGDVGVIPSTGIGSIYHPTDPMALVFKELPAQPLISWGAIAIRVRIGMVGSWVLTGSDAAFFGAHIVTNRTDLFEGRPTSAYKAYGGTLHVTASGNSSGENLSLTLVGATFRHVNYTYDSDRNATAAEHPDGCTATVSNVAFSGALR